MEADRLAKKMLQWDEDMSLPIDLSEKLRLIDTLIYRARGGGAALRSSQVVALVVLDWVEKTRYKL